MYICTGKVRVAAVAESARFQLLCAQGVSKGLAKASGRGAGSAVGSDSFQE